MMDNLIDINDLSRDDIDQIYRMTEEMKNFPQSYYHALEDKTLLMLFEKPSTRTRVSFEAGMTQLGGHAIYFTKEHSQLSRGESLKDTSKVLSRYTDGMMARLHTHDDLLHMAGHADVPVINGLTDLLHPCQALADLYTLKEKVDDLQDQQVVFIGDGNNVAHSLMQACAQFGVDFTLSCPQGYEPDREIIDRARSIGDDTGATIKIVHDPHHAVRGADVLYTDVAVSMGQEDERAERLNVFRHYQVDQELVSKAGDPFVMHPLPAHRGQEITADVIDGPNSIVYDQAENRLHVQKAVLYLLMKERAPLKQ